MPSTTHLNTGHILPIADALEFSNHSGYVLNAFVTIVWKHSGITDQAQASASFERFREKLRKWLLNHDVEPRFLWIAENSRSNGIHHHLLVHCPDELVPALRIIADRWVPAPRPGTKGRPVAIKTPWPNANAVKAQDGIVRYMLKTADQAITVTDPANGEVLNLAALLGIAPRKADDNDAGPITVKRVGTTENIGRKARQDAGFVSRLDRCL